MTSLRVPVEIDRDTAGAAAREELSRQIYLDAQPSLTQQAMQWAIEQLGRILDSFTEGVTTLAPGGWASVVILVAVLIAALVAIRLRMGRIARSRAVQTTTSVVATLSARQHRQRAEAAAKAGDFSTAISERFRAFVAEIEERTVVDTTTGRTAIELASLAAGSLDVDGSVLVDAARVFGDVFYGHHAADSTKYEIVVAADELARTGRIIASNPQAEPVVAPS
ncbi:DUF4129 domain-containing protein [Hoyosella rhizosphaerae]|uniref:DUF4129 domain-containing protein n=1 Tax=Hoyosella rhizosphaerae TaxID=1755582 RepID=UPI0016685ED5|nr:DUF4129 domain-containing protein [Hoyosella rhizosphaerae]MBN4926672.1 DUF4129 domain-containing protein [Hoyosella rhizosphaerae]